LKDEVKIKRSVANGIAHAGFSGLRAFSGKKPGSIETGTKTKNINKYSLKMISPSEKNAPNHFIKNNFGAE